MKLLSRLIQTMYILGGLDYQNKEKFNNSEYIERTYSAPKGLTKILQYFERIEAGMNPEWTDTQKCMYAYNALAVDTEYVKNLKQDILSDGVTERGLNGVLYNQLTCAGMAQTFKEMMDRLDIPCYYQNQRHVHAFNVVELGGQYRGIDVTWDCNDCNKNNKEKCSFYYFGRDSNFYKKYGHQIAGDNEETVFDLTTFSDEELRENYGVIRNAIDERKKIVHHFRNFDRDRKKKFLPVDKFMENLEDEKVAITKLKLLRDFGTIPEEMKDVVDGASPRFGFVADYIGNRGKRNTLSEISQDSNLDGELIMENSQVLLFTHDENGISRKALTQEQKEEITPMLLEDVKEYYKQYFETEAPQIDNLLENYAMIENMPPEVASKAATLKTNLYTKIRLFANGDTFFEELGFSKENIESTCGKAKKYLENKKEIESSSISKHESDLDFLSAIVQNDVIDTIISGRDYTEEDLQKLMKDVRASWEDAEFSDDEFKLLLDEVMDKSMSSEEISRATVNSEIGIEEANAVANEIRKMQTKDLLQYKEKE